MEENGRVNWSYLSDLPGRQIFHWHVQLEVFMLMSLMSGAYFSLLLLMHCLLLLLFTKCTCSAKKEPFYIFNDTSYKTLCRNKPSKTTRPLRPTTESSFAATTGSFDPFNTPAPPTTPSSAPGSQLFSSSAEFSFLLQVAT